MEQIKNASNAGYMLANRKNVDKIAQRFKNIDRNCLSELVKKIKADNSYKLKTQAEKDCYSLIHDLDIVAGNVQGSITSKKDMQSEIWSAIYHIGSPIWYITLSPADENHPLCIYYAGNKIAFDSKILSPEIQKTLISVNPTAAAKFFDHIVRAFIKHVLGVGTNHEGIYGNTAGYYGTVE